MQEPTGKFAEVYLIFLGCNFFIRKRVHILHPLNFYSTSANFPFGVTIAAPSKDHDPICVCR